MSNPEDSNYWMKVCKETSLQMVSFKELKKQRTSNLTNEYTDELTSDDYIKLNTKLCELYSIAKEYIMTGKPPKFIIVYLETTQKCKNFITELKKYLPVDYKIETFIYPEYCGRELTITLNSTGI